LSDVLAGSFIGIAGGILCVFFTRNIGEEQLIIRKKKDKPKEVG
jgi:membrane-associated phospholipid phosphatase